MLTEPTRVLDPDGDVYEGDFRFGRREGKGTYRYFKGEKYEGALRPRAHPPFASVLPNYTTPGEWYADKMHGRGKYTYVTGKVFDGVWRDDRPHGQGKLIDGGRRFDMVYDNGVVTVGNTTSPPQDRAPQADAVCVSCADAAARRGGQGGCCQGRTDFLARMVAAGIRMPASHRLHGRQGRQQSKLSWPAARRQRPSSRCLFRCENRNRNVRCRSDV